MADWLVTPLVHSYLNARRNLESAHVKWQIHLGMFNHWVDESPRNFYDMILCTPPYLPPVPGFADVRAQSPVAGTELLGFLISNPIARDTYISFSSLVEAEVMKLAAGHNTEMKLIADPIKVPFRVPVALRSVPYIRNLLEMARLEFRSDERHPFWHELKTFRVRPRASPISKNGT